jgi:hypothetical protein
MSTLFQQTLKGVNLMKMADLVGRVEDALRKCFGDIPFLRSLDFRQENRDSMEHLDLVATLDLPGEKVRLLVDVKSRGEPRLARQAVNQLVRYRDAFSGSYAVFAAPYISAESARICKADKVGFLDLAGNCFLSFGNVFISREGRPNPFSERRALRSLFRPKAERVHRVLLETPGKAWRTTALAKEAGVSLGHISNVKRLLEDREWIRAGAEGLVLSEPRRLLAEWAQSYDSARSYARGLYTMKTILEIEQGLAHACVKEGIRYALTGFSAAARWAPAVKYPRVVAYVSGDVEAIVRRLDLRDVPTGANVTLLSPYDEGVYYGVRSVDEVQVVCPVQAYLDVQGQAARGQEAAEALLVKEIRPRW